MRAITMAHPLTVFPREFERRFWEDINKRFYTILISSWIIVNGMVTIMGTIEYDSDIFSARARENYLEMIKNNTAVSLLEPIVKDDQEQDDVMSGQDVVTTTPKTVDQASDQPRTVEDQGPSVVEAINDRRAHEASRSEARKQMANEVSGTGILGVLSAGGSGGSGDVVFDAFGDGTGGSSDLDAVISGVGGLATAGTSSRNTVLGSRGSGRVTGSASVDDLLTGLGSSGSTSIGRVGSISMALESARVSGSGSKAVFRSSEEISRVINTHTNAIEYCYKREARLNPNLSGNILLEFIIGANGHVKSTRIIKSTLQNKSIESCIISRVRGWRFKPISKNEGDVAVRQKYIFG